MADLSLKLYIESPHQYLVDLDNDGEQELIARLWLSQPDGRLEYQHRLFKKQNGQWQQWSLPVSEGDADLGSRQWFFVESFENSQYIVAYTVGEDVDAGLNPITLYALTIYQLKANQLSLLGEIRTHQPRQSEQATSETQGIAE
jgi:hypothetical protein